MRMRRKKNLEARLEACGDYIIYLDRDEKNFQDKSNKQLIDFEKIFGNPCAGDRLWEGSVCKRDSKEKS